MEAVQVQNKFKLLFEKINEPGYVMNNYYADALINSLSDGSEPEICSKLLGQLSDLITTALDHTEKHHVTVSVFLTRLLAIVAHKELHFTIAFCKKGDVIGKALKEFDSPDMKPSSRVAYLELALALLSHDSGTGWILETGIWKDILDLSNEKQTIFVIRQKYKFASKLIWKLNDMGDEENVKLILGHILKPLIQTELIKLDTISTAQEDELCKSFEPMLHILLSIVAEVERLQKSNIVIAVLTKEYTITSHVYVMIDRIRNDHITVLAGKLNFWMCVAKTFLAKPFTPDTVYLGDDVREISVMYFNVIQTLVQRRAAITILDFCIACNMIWMRVSKNQRLKYGKNTVNPQNQLLVVCLVPVVVYVKDVKKKEKLQERVEEFITKLLHISCQHTARAAYSLRDLIGELDSMDLTVQAVKRLTCLKNYLNDEQANLLFTALFFILTEYEEDNSLEYYDDSQDKILVMTYVLDTVLYLVKNHNINWQESLEVLCLYNCVYNILKRRNLSCKFVVTALNLIAITIKKFLPPNLSLLMDSKPGSSMDELGKLIFMRMHDMHWETRDSALELLLVCTEISYIKFPPFQKQILDNSLVNVAATLAFNDHEAYVQASALKCVGAASMVSAIWDQLTEQYPDLLDKLLSILTNNQEGIVRKEACSVLCNVYQNIKLCPAFKTTLYEHMVSAALSDFHWEVQLTALKFWKIVIQSLLNDQGMLDGTFPPVTFSRETRKIVTLNEAELQRRLLRVLGELSAIGCLTVLVKLLDEDTEGEIIDAALNISLDFINILNKYKVPEIIKPKDDDVNTFDELQCVDKEVNIQDIKKEEESEMADAEEESDMVDAEEESEMADAESTNKAENVINGIIKSDDMNLLASIYETQMKLKTEKQEVCTPQIKLAKVASPYLFVNYLKSQDFKAVVEQKRKWKDGIRSISSLLDDILGRYEVIDEINTLDCY